MTPNAHQLVNAILAACSAGAEDSALQAATVEIRRALLDFGSETPDNLACAAQVEFGASVGRQFYHERIVGLRLAGTNVLMSDIMNVAEGAAIPEPVREAYPELTQEQWDAVGRLVTLILVSLERGE